MQPRPVKKRTDRLLREIRFTGRYGGFSNLSMYATWGRNAELTFQQVWDARVHNPRTIMPPFEVKWHINVDRTEGKPITPELFAKSKANYVVRDQPMDIIGFYSENHPGVFISPTRRPSRPTAA